MASKKPRSATLICLRVCACDAHSRVQLLLESFDGRMESWLQIRLQHEFHLGEVRMVARVNFRHVRAQERTNTNEGFGGGAALLLGADFACAVDERIVGVALVTDVAISCL